MSDITCPFCGETGFDKIGLKNHLVVGGLFGSTCKEFENTLSVAEERELRKIKKEGGFNK